MKRQLTREERKRRRRTVSVVCIVYALALIGCLVASFWRPGEMLGCLVLLIAAGAALGVWSIWEED